MLFLAGLGSFLWSFLLLWVDLARFAWAGLKTVLRPPRLVMGGRSIGRLPRGVVLCVLASAWWRTVKSMCGFFLDLVSAVVGAFVNTGPTCGQCGDYVLPNGCACGASPAPYRSSCDARPDDAATGAQRAEALALEQARCNARDVNDTWEAFPGGFVGVPAPGESIAPRDVVVMGSDGLLRRRLRAEAEVLATPACDVVVNGIGPFPDPWERECEACGRGFGVEASGAAVFCLCKGQVLEYKLSGPAAEVSRSERVFGS